MNIWLTNIGYEETILPKTKIVGIESANFTNYSMPQISLWLARENDLVILGEQPSGIVIENLLKIRGIIPKIYCLKDYIDRTVGQTLTEVIHHNPIVLEEICALLNNQVGEHVLIPYAVTEKEISLAKKLNCKIWGPNPFLVEKYSNKGFIKKIMQECNINTLKGYFAESVNVLENIIAEIYEKKNSKTIVLKELFGVSGKGLHICRNKKETMRILKHIIRHNKKFEGLIIEEWLNEAKSYNCQVLISNSEIKIVGVTEQICVKGVYNGSVFSETSVLPEQVKEEYFDAVYKTAKILYEDRYEGIVSIDSIIDKEEIYPVIEINPRFSQSTYFIEVLKALGKNKLIVKTYNTLKNEDEINISLKKNNEINIFIMAVVRIDMYKTRFYIAFSGEHEEEIKNNIYKFERWIISNKLNIYEEEKK